MSRLQSFKLATASLIGLGNPAAQATAYIAPTIVTAAVVAAVATPSEADAQSGNLPIGAGDLPGLTNPPVTTPCPIAATSDCSDKPVIIGGTTPGNGGNGGNGGAGGNGTATATGIGTGIATIGDVAGGSINIGSGGIQGGAGGTGGTLNVAPGGLQGGAGGSATGGAGGTLNVASGGVQGGAGGTGTGGSATGGTLNVAPGGVQGGAGGTATANGTVTQNGAPVTVNNNNNTKIPKNTPNVYGYVSANGEVASVGFSIAGFGINGPLEMGRTQAMHTATNLIAAAPSLGTCSATFKTVARAERIQNHANKFARMADEETPAAEKLTKDDFCPAEGTTAQADGETDYAANTRSSASNIFILVNGAATNGTSPNGEYDALKGCPKNDKGQIIVHLDKTDGKYHCGFASTPGLATGPKM